MLTYISAFIFYTLAMIGILLIGFVIYKKTFFISKNENKGLIKIIDSLNIAPKKMLFVVKIRNEKFLIASGAEHTTFLAKLEDDNPKKPNNIQKQQKLDPPKPIQKEQERLNKIQQQFKDLYFKNSPEEVSTDKKNEKKEIINRLLKDLNGV